MMIVKWLLHVYLSPRIIFLLRNRIFVEAAYKSYSYLVRELLSKCLICNPRVIESLSVSDIEIMICDVSSYVYLTPRVAPIWQVAPILQSLCRAPIW